MEQTSRFWPIRWNSSRGYVDLLKTQNQYQREYDGAFVGGAVCSVAYQLSKLVLGRDKRYCWI
jgi:hypothetical protein